MIQRFGDIMTSLSRNRKIKIRHDVAEMSEHYLLTFYKHMFLKITIRIQLMLKLLSHFKSVYPLACSRLRDGGGKSFRKKKCKKRAGAGERQGSAFSLPFFPPPPPPFPSRARLIFALLVLIRSHYTIWHRLCTPLN